MRNIYFSTLLIICICFCSCNHYKTKADIHSKSDSLQLFAYIGGVGTFLDTINVIHIVATIYNPTKDTVRFGSMTCSYEDFFTVDNDVYSIQSRYDCYSNFPNVISLPPNSKTDRFIMIKYNKSDTSSKREKFRIGMFYLKYYENATLDSATKFYQNRFQQKAIWSNELNINRMYKIVYQ